MTKSKLGWCPKCKEKSTVIRTAKNGKRTEICINKGCGYVISLPALLKDCNLCGQAISLCRCAIALFMLLVMSTGVLASPDVILRASWYSVESLHKDGQWSITKGVCADGSQFKNEEFTCAMWGYPLGTYVKITSIATKKWVVCRVSDRINRRFAGLRVDLAPAAFKAIAPLSQGIVSVKVEVMK